jgi:hypothetical protein
MDFRDKVSACKPKSAGIIGLFRAFLVKQDGILAEIDKAFDFSNKA